MIKYLIINALPYIERDGEIYPVRVTTDADSVADTPVSIDIETAESYREYLHRPYFLAGLNIAERGEASSIDVEAPAEEPAEAPVEPEAPAAKPAPKKPAAKK